MKIKPKSRPLHTLNSSEQEQMDHFISGTEVGTSAHQKDSWNTELGFKEDDYSIVIGCGSPCSGSVSSLLKPTRHLGRLQLEQVVLRSKDSRSKPPLVTNFYISANNTKLHSG